MTTVLPVEPARVDGLVRRAQWYARARVARPQHRFVALVHVGDTVELARPSEEVAGSAACVAVNSRDDPARVSLGRVTGFFYIPPPLDGSSDALSSVAPRPPYTLQHERMFVVVWPFQGQTVPQAKLLEDHGLISHAIRSPQPMLHDGRLPLQVHLLEAVLRAVLVKPAAWAGPLAMTQVHKYGNSPHAAASARRKEVAAGREGDILLFWPPDRDTFLPPTSMACPPVRAEGANEEEEREPGEEEE